MQCPVNPWVPLAELTIAGQAQTEHQSTWEILLSEVARTALSAVGRASPGIDNLTPRQGRWRLLRSEIGAADGAARTY